MRRCGRKALRNKRIRLIIVTESMEKVAPTF
jgi:hypothetical protein